MKHSHFKTHVYTLASLLVLALTVFSAPSWADDATGETPDQFVPLDQKTADQALEDLKTRLKNPNPTSADLTSNSALTHGITIGDPAAVEGEDRIFRPVDPIMKPIRIHPEPPIRIFYPDVPILPVKRMPPAQLQQIAMTSDQDLGYLEISLSAIKQERAQALASGDRAAAAALKTKLVTVQTVISQLRRHQAPLQEQINKIYRRPHPIPQPLPRPCISNLFVNGHWAGCRPEPGPMPVGPPVRKPFPVPKDPFHVIDPNTDPTLHGQLNVK